MSERVRVQCLLDGRWLTVARTSFTAGCAFMFRCRDNANGWRLRTADGYAWRFNPEGAFRCERRAGSFRSCKG